MEPAHDTRFDPNTAVQLLLEVAHEQSLERVLEKLIQAAAERPAVACVQIWLVRKGDLCLRCARRAECADQSHCLHLVAGKGKSVRRLGQTRFDDPNTRLPLGLGMVGEAIERREQTFVRELQRVGTVAGFEWIKAEGMVESAVTPVVFKGEVLGVIIVFTRSAISQEARPWGRIFADHLGAAIANARAFEEIQELKRQLEQRNTYLQEEVVEAKAFGGLVGQSGPLRQIVSQIELVAPTEASVLILGDTGTGKELVAHEIHRRSQRAEGPFIRVNCASIPRELFESEFFGHVKGAFTGAIKDRAGRFESAEGGTIFLDEIGEVPLEMQSKLLRVLQEKLYERVGEDRTRFANARIIAATNRDLKKAVAAGRFREDLFYRLHVFPIQVPPLSERKDDIPLLANHFLELSVREMKCARPRLTRAAVARLQAYDWPGNVRELRNVIERAVILARGGTLDFDLPVRTSPATSSRGGHKIAPHAGVRHEPEFLTEAELQQRERENLRIVLGKANWKIKGPNGAAELLGIKPATLVSRIKKWKMERTRVE